MEIGLVDAERFWRHQARIDARNDFELRYQHGEGPCSVFIVDTSKSIGEEGFNQIKDIFSTIIDEFANHPEEDENIAVIVRGKVTRFQQYYSNRYSEIKSCLDTIEYGGLSPLTGAFLLSLGAIETDAGKGYSKGICEFKVRPRIILMSDGRPTDFHIFSDGEDSSLNESLQAKDNLQHVVKHLGKRHPIFCIPVGKNPDVVYLKYLSSRGGRMIHPHEVKQIARYTQNLRATALLSYTQNSDGINRQTLDSLLQSALPGKIFSDADKDDIMDIYSKRSFFTMNPPDSDDEEDGDDMKYVERDLCLPNIGTRVKRGPDWHRSDQDDNGPGTVIGHSKNAGWLKVEWDSGARNDYRYGATFMDRVKYEVAACCEPRILHDKIIAVGCVVTRGPDWELGDEDGGEGSLGSVCQIKLNGIVFVRWPNRCLVNHRFGFDGKFDILICDPFSPEVISFLQANCDAISAFTRTSSEPHRTGFLKGIYEAGVGGKDNVKHGKGGLESPCLKLPKGQYFKNDRVSEDSSSDVEADGPKESETYTAEKQWLWRDYNGKWKPYPRKINDRINKCYDRNPHSTVVVVINEQTYRVVMAKNTQINLETRETQEIKLVKNV